MSLARGEHVEKSKGCLGAGMSCYNALLRAECALVGHLYQDRHGVRSLDLQVVDEPVALAFEQGIDRGPPTVGFARFFGVPYRVVM
jgi:hypothetical protein